MRGRNYVLPQDVYDVARDVLRHRVLLSYEALADGVDVEEIVERIVQTVVAPRVTAHPGRPVRRWLREGPPTPPAPRRRTKVVGSEADAAPARARS